MPRIEDYPLIGDYQAAALVGVRWVDWLAVLLALRFRACLPTLPGTPDHGHTIQIGEDLQAASQGMFGTLALKSAVSKSLLWYINHDTCRGDGRKPRPHAGGL